MRPKRHKREAFSLLPVCGQKGTPAPFTYLSWNDVTCKRCLRLRFKLKLKRKVQKMTQLVHDFFKPRKQCAKCPWKVSVNPREIPDGYCEIKHAALKDTIAGVEQSLLAPVLRIMACHEAHKKPCVGWLINQLGLGNNIALRLAVAKGQIDACVEIDGPQHSCFEDTLPREKKLQKDNV